MDVISPNSPLDIHLRRSQQQSLVDDDLSVASGETTAFWSILKKFYQTACLYLNRALSVACFLLTPWHFVEVLFLKKHLAVFCLGHKILSDDDEEMRKLNEKKAIDNNHFKAIAFASFHIALISWLVANFGCFAVALGLFAFVILPALPVALNCWLFSSHLGPCLIQLMKTLRRCTFLLAEIQIVHLGYSCAAKCRPTTSLLDRLADEQNKEAVVRLQSSLNESLGKVRVLIHDFVNDAVLLPPSVEARRLVVGKGFNHNDNETSPGVHHTATVQIRRSLSVTCVYLFDVAVVIARCVLLLSRWRLVKTFAYSVQLLLRLRKCVVKLDNAYQRAIYADLNNSFGNVEQFSSFVYTNSDAKQSNDFDKISDFLRSFVLHLIEVNERSKAEILPILQHSSNLSSLASLDELINRLHTCINLLSDIKQSLEGPRSQNVDKIISDVNIKADSEDTVKMQEKEEEKPAKDEELELYFADTSSPEFTLSETSRNFGNLPGQMESVNFLTELRSVLTERTKMTETKERELLKRQGVDMDDILRSLEEASDDDNATARRSRQCEECVEPDEEAMKARRDLLADFKLVSSARRKNDTDEVVIGDDTSSSSSSSNLL